MKKEKAAKTVEQMTDDEVLTATDHGRFGPAIVGKELHARSASILKATGGGMFGPALTDPDYAKKKAAARAQQDADDTGNEEDTGRDDEDDEDEEDDDEEVDDTGNGATTADDESSVDPSDLADPRNPWYFVTLSGAKMLAQQKGVSYQPRVKRAELIAALQAANVEPPAPPANPDAED